MSNIVPARQGSLARDTRMLALIRRTVAADTNDDEFSMFVMMADALRLDPLRRQIYAFVYNRDKPDKRRMSIIVAIDGLRAIADRTGAYRPDDEEPTIEFDAAMKGPLNPAGIVKATVRVFKHSHGEWHRVTASAYWDEYAPISDEWAFDEASHKRKPTGRKTLDTSGNWGKMPRLMLSKVAEALALRKAWPDDFANVYGEEEIERSRVIDATPAELAQQGAIEEREAKIGGPQISIDWLDGRPIDGVPIGKFADRVIGFLDANKDEPGTVATWADRNRIGLREFWKHHPGDALALKQRIEAAQAEAAQ